MTPEELFECARVFALPLRREFRGITVREGLLVEGPSGWGEFAPFHDHTDAHASRWLEAALEQAFGHWPTPVRDRIPVNAIIPAVDAPAASEWTEDALSRGCTTMKVKVGSSDFDADVQRVAAVRGAMDAAGVEGSLRIDANGAWTVRQAIDRIAVLDDIAVGLEYVEQPVADRAELVQVRRETNVRLAVDEGIRLADDPSDAIAQIAEVADIAIIKAIPLGGVGRALEVAAASPISVVVSGSLDTSVGLASGLWLAATLPELPFACGLGTGTLFQHDVVMDTRVVVDGSLQVERRVPDEVDPCGLVDAQMRDRWRRRLLAAWKHARVTEAIA